MMAQPPDTLPLSTLLSQTLVAFTVEFDNEAEHRLPHRTTNHGATAGSVHAPWLVSMAMWLNCMRFVGEDGITVRELERTARTPTNLAGMQRWGYITLAPDPADRRSKPPQWAWVVRATPGGRLMQSVCRPLFAEIEGRWEKRFGAATMQRLRSALETVASGLDSGLPDCMPILGYGLRCAERLIELRATNPEAEQERTLAALLARVLLAFAIEFEEDSEIALAIHANLLRLLNEEGIRMRDLPILSGVSKESLHMAVGILRKKNLATLAADPQSKSGKIARLTETGREAQKRCRALVEITEKAWREGFGDDQITALRTALEELVGDGVLERSPLFQCTEPYPEGWRASLRQPSTLPHFPMVLHRGGFPDGS